MGGDALLGKRHSAVKLKNMLLASAVDTHEPRHLQHRGPAGDDHIAGIIAAAGLRGLAFDLLVLGEHHRRIVSWHLRQSRKDVWLEELTDGDINYWAVADEVREHHLPRLFTVELALENGTQISRSVVENHRRSREYVRRVFEV